MASILPSDAARARLRGGSSGPLAAVAAASAAVLALCLAASFRLGVGDEPALLARANGARVLLAAAAGATLALAGALRQALGHERPLFELRVLGLAVGAAGGGIVLASGRSGAAAIALFGLGAALGAGVALALVRLLDRPRRWTNLGAALLLAGLAAGAALVPTQSAARRDALAPVAAWLLGDLSGASLAGAAAIALVVAALAAAALRGLAAPGAEARLRTLSVLALGVGFGAAGLVAFVGSFVPRAVRSLAPRATARGHVAASLAAGAATLAAIDAVPRFLVGGYASPLDVTAAMLAIPIFLVWNRRRLRREAGPAHLAFEVFEWAVIAALTVGAVAFAAFLTMVVRGAT